MIIIGIDPGTKETGVAVIQTSGNIDKSFRTLNSTSLLEVNILKPVASNLYASDYLAYMIHCIKDLCSRYNPDEVHIEKMIVAYNNRNTALLIVLQNEISLFCKLNNIRYYEVANTTVKLNITGKGRGSKEEVNSKINKMFNSFIDNNNITDAIAIALTYPPKKKAKKRKR